MLPYASSGYGGGYGRRKGFFNSPSTIAAAVTVVLLAALGFAGYTHFRASALYTAKVALQRDLENARSEMFSLKSQFASRNADLEQLQMTHGHAQRRLTELNNQLQRKEADLISKEQILQQQINERTVAEQHRSAREAELSRMVDDLRQELIRTDGIVDALDKKVATMEEVHGQREKDWHKLAGTWVKYEQDLHEQYKKCTEEVSKLRNITMAMNDTAPVPEAEPKIRPETDFDHINVVVPEHKAHTFAPLAPPTPSPVPAATTGATGAAADLPLPEAKIRESIVQMTGGQVGLEPGQAVPTPTPSPSPSPAPAGDAAADAQQQQHAAPSPNAVHHHDIYHGDFHGGDLHEFHGGDHHEHDHYQGHYDHYHGHYEAYDPMDQYWLRDAHGDWNADFDDTAHHHHFDQDPDFHHDSHFDDHHDQHHNQHHINEEHGKRHDDIHDQNQHRHQYQEQHHYHQQQQPDQHQQHHAAHAAAGGSADPHYQQQQQQHYQHHQQQAVPTPMAGMGGAADNHYNHHQQQQQQPQQPHAEHAPSRWHHDQHAQQQQQYQQYQQQQQQQHQQYHQQHYQHQQQQQQQHQQQHGSEHGRHPQGDLAYKMGW